VVEATELGIGYRQIDVQSGSEFPDCRGVVGRDEGRRRHRESALEAAVAQQCSDREHLRSAPERDPGAGCERAPRQARRRRQHRIPHPAECPLWLSRGLPGGDVTRRQPGRDDLPLALDWVVRQRRGDASVLPECSQHAECGGRPPGDSFGDHQVLVGERTPELACCLVGTRGGRNGVLLADVAPGAGTDCDRPRSGRFCEAAVDDGHVEAEGLPDRPRHDRRRRRPGGTDRDDRGPHHIAVGENLRVRTRRVCQQVRVRARGADPLDPRRLRGPRDQDEPRHGPSVSWYISICT